MAESKITARDAIANCLLMGSGAYKTPEDFADAVLKRLNHEGFAVVHREPTEAMMAAVGCAGEKREWPSGRAWLAGWKAMVEACRNA